MLRRGLQNGDRHCNASGEANDVAAQCRPPLSSADRHRAHRAALVERL